MVTCAVAALLFVSSATGPQSTATNCTAYVDTCAANGHDIGHDPASAAGECASICSSTPGCCVAEFDSHISRCYLKHADAGALRPLRNGSGIFGINCTGPCGVSPAPTPAPGPGPGPGPEPAVPISVVVNASAAAAAPFPPYWKRSFGSGHAALTLRADWRRHLRLVGRWRGLRLGISTSCRCGLRIGIGMSYRRGLGISALTTV